jgi:hypothetical protein
MKKLIWIALIVLVLVPSLVVFAQSATPATPASLQTIVLGIAGVLLSLLFTYVPAAKAWFDSKSNKGLLMLGFVILVSLAYFGLGCTSLAAQLSIAVTCDQAGILALGQMIVTVAMFNQTTFLFTQPGTPKALPAPAVKTP